MGTVRLTDKRKSEYKDKANEMFDKSHPRPDFTPEETISIMQAMANHPLQVAIRTFAMEQNAIYNVDDNDDESRLPFNLEFDKLKLDAITCKQVENKKAIKCYLPTPLTLYGESGWRYGARKDALDFVPDKFLSDPKEILILQAAIRRVTDEREAQNAAHHAFVNGVQNALTNCNTLGQLIKLWPAASKLASTEDMSQLHKKETRTQQASRVREEIDLDVSALNSTVLTASLLGD